MDHPYERRLRLREKLPWFLIKLGLADKGEDCEIVGAKHSWFNIDDKNSGCYYCKVEKEGQLFEKKKPSI